MCFGTRAFQCAASLEHPELFTIRRNSPRDDAPGGRHRLATACQRQASKRRKLIERDTGARRYFEVPLAQALDIFNDAYRTVSGLGRSVRGPSMSTTAGKVVVEDITELQGEELFLLKFLQARNPQWVGRTFFARFDPKAAWLDDLQPPLGEREFFFGGADGAA